VNNILQSALPISALLLATVAPASLAEVSTVSDANFSQAVLSSSTPVVVDFYADWCGPCRHMSPVVENLSSQYGGQVKFVRVNIDNSPQSAARFGISSIPAFRVFKGGRMIGSATGVMSMQSLEATINQAIRRTASTGHGL
jgi:thioredoxin 1